MAYEVTDSSTKHGLITPHGTGTPHKWPTIPGEDSQTAIFAELARQLYPTGRAFYINFGSVFYNLHKAINVSFLRVIESANATIDSTFPDNENFSLQDALLWEYRLGLTLSDTLPLDQRKLAILRKMAYPSNIVPRQNPRFIESQLRDAGFDVYIHENRFFENGEWVYKTPDEVTNISVSNSQHGEPAQHGDSFQHGSAQFSVIANLAIPNEVYAVGGANLYATFFIGGEILGNFAAVPQNRLVEFKELVLKLKPAHTVAFTFINFV